MVDIIINIIYAFVFLLTAAFRLTPIVSLPSEITDSISSASAAVMSLDEILPVHEILFIFLSVFLLYELAYFGMKLINWVIRKIPGIS